MDALVSNHGYLITFDNWHNYGYGRVVAIYRPDGKLVSSFELDGLCERGRIAQLRHTVSSRYWRCRPRSFIDPEKQTKLYVRLSLGGSFVFDLRSGEVSHQIGKKTGCWQAQR